MSEDFCQPVRNHLKDWNVLEVVFSSSHFVTIVVVLNVNLLYLCVINRVLGKGNGSLIVTFERDRDIC